MMCRCCDVGIICVAWRFVCLVHLGGMALLCGHWREEAFVYIISIAERWP